MANTTLLRVKRRRDDVPPPSTFRMTIDDKLDITSNPSKRARHGMNQLTHLMSNTFMFNHNNDANIVSNSSTNTEDNGTYHKRNKSHAVIFQKVTYIPTTATTSIKDRNQNGYKKRKNNNQEREDINDNSNNENNNENNNSTSTEKNIGNHNDDHGEISSSSSDDVQFNVIDAKLTPLQDGRQGNALLLQRSSSSSTSNQSKIMSTNNNSTTTDKAKNIQNNKTNNKNNSNNDSQQDQQQDDELPIVEQPPPSKRKRLSLHMMESRIMTEKEFWNCTHTTTTNTATNSSVSTKDTTSSSSPTARVPSTSIAATTIATSKSSPQNKKKTKNGNIILDPITQMINQSLASLHPSIFHPYNHGSSNDNDNTNDHNGSHNHHDYTAAIMKHMSMIQTHGSSKIRKFINWQCTSTTTTLSKNKPNYDISNGSTILHMTALLNSVAGAEYICSNYSGIIDFDILDNDGYTARDVAELVGSDGVAKIISNYMGNCTSSKNQKWCDRIINGKSYVDGADSEERGGSERDGTEEGREEDYVYDVYCLKNYDGNEVESRADDGLKKQSTSSSESWYGRQGCREDYAFNDAECDVSTDSDPIVVKMHGGVGYWNEKGELVLETIPNKEDNHSDFCDEEYDSNCEDYDGNDYPDEDENESFNEYSNGIRHDYIIPRAIPGYGHTTVDEYDSDSDEDLYHGSSEFRNYAMDFTKANYAMHQYEDDEDDGDDGDYAGYMHTDDSQWSCERIYGEAYDPNRDEDE